MKDSCCRILWKGQISGPFAREEVEAMLAKNEIGVWAEISEGNSDWKPISEWRVRESAFKAAPKVIKSEPKLSAPPRMNVVSESPQSPNLPELPPLPVSTLSEPDQHVAQGGYSEFESAATRHGDSGSGFFYWALMPLRKYGVFSGRARRKEYWLYTLLTGLLFGAFFCAEVYLEGASTYDKTLLEFVYMVDFAVFLVLLVPNLAVLARRLHDTNRSGWWVLISLTGIGSLVLLLFAVQEGTEGENEYGADPQLTID